MSDLYGRFKIAKAEPSDAAAIREIAVAGNIDAWHENDYLAEINRPDSFVLKAVVSGKICGFLLARIVPGKADKPDIDLYNIAVQPKLERLGIGSALIAGLLSRIVSTEAENLWLEVRESNKAAIRFYEKHGFTIELTRSRFYRDPVENALIMRLKIDPPRAR